MRQWNLLRLRNELARRGVTPSTFSSSSEEITKHLKKTRYLPLETALANGMSVYAVRLNGFRDLLRWQTQTDTYFNQEISDRVRVIACLTTLPNIIHSDSPGESLTSAEWGIIKKSLCARDDDTVVIVWGPEADARLGAQEIAARAKEATVGIPSETRQALKDGTNGFERILPGPDRMYPDTDLPPKRIPAERLEAIRAKLPPHLVARERWYAEIGVPRDLVPVLSLSKFGDLFETAVKAWGLSPKLAALVLAQYPKRLKRKGLPWRNLDEASLSGALEAVRSGLLRKEGILPLLARVLTERRTVAEILSAGAPKGDVAREIDEIVAGMAGRPFSTPGGAARRTMGLLMTKWRGYIDAAEAARRAEARLAESQVRP